MELKWSDHVLVLVDRKEQLFLMIVVLAQELVVLQFLVQVEEQQVLLQMSSKSLLLEHLVEELVVFLF